MAMPDAAGRQLASMTGFARHDGSHETSSWNWELRSVNGRGLDLRLRLPNGFSALEKEVRERASRHLTRGNLQISLQLRREESTAKPSLNEEVFLSVLAAAERAADLAGTARPDIEHLISVRGVIDVQDVEETEEQNESLQAALLASFDEAIAKIIDMRRSEGEALKLAVKKALEAIKIEYEAIAASPARTQDAMRERLQGQLAKLMDANDDRVDDARLHQELALLLTKVDISEELTRLEAHLIAAHELLDAGGACGRRLDFLTQELNREANTICSKSHDVAITQHGLEMKVLIDQIREQVQNIE